MKYSLLLCLTFFSASTFAQSGVSVGGILFRSGDQYEALSPSDQCPSLTTKINPMTAAIEFYMTNDSNKRSRLFVSGIDRGEQKLHHSGWGRSRNSRVRYKAWVSGKNIKAYEKIPWTFQVQKAYTKKFDIALSDSGLEFNAEDGWGGKSSCKYRKLGDSSPMAKTTNFASFYHPDCTLSYEIRSPNSNGDKILQELEQKGYKIQSSGSFHLNILSATEKIFQLYIREVEAGKEREEWMCYNNCDQERGIKKALKQLPRCIPFSL